MAGRFRGAVGRLSRPKKSRLAKRATRKRTAALVRRAPKLSAEDLQQRVAELIGAASSGDAGPSTVAGGGGTSAGKKILSRVNTRAAPKAQAKLVGRAAMEIVGDGTERVVPKKDIALPERAAAEAMGLKLLRRAVKNQSHNRLLPHQNRHDYEYRLRMIATTGVVHIFNSLAQARKAGAAVETEEKHLTADKIQEKKQIATKEAFFAALCQSRKMERY